MIGTKEQDRVNLLSVIKLSGKIIKEAVLSLVLPSL